MTGKLNHFDLEISKRHRYLVVIAGPTAVGKTALSIALAKHYNAAIISADSRQFFRELVIGTAKPTPEEMLGVPHYFIDSHSIVMPYNAAKFEEDVLQLLPSLFERSNIVFLVGGSGLYIQAVTEGMDPMPQENESIRKQLNETFQHSGLPVLLEELKQKDPDYYEEVDTANPQRVIRALEVIRSTEQAYSVHRRNTKKERPFHILKIAVTMEKEVLYSKIDKRMDLMLDRGLAEEARMLYPYKDHNALQTVGYKEIFDFMEGKYPWEEAVRLLKRNSRRYAKRQLTWFRRDKEFQWFSPDQETGIKTLIDSFCSRS